MLNKLVKDIKSYEGLTRKNDVSRILRLQKTLKFGENLRLGDDTAVMPYNDEYLLFSADGIWSKLVSDPFWVGYCSVLVNVNDVYSMGGTPKALVDVLSMRKEDEDEILEGIETACEKFQVPMVGGHIHPDSHTSVAVAVLGTAKKVLNSFDASPGEKVVLALDLDGQQYKNYMNWDTTSTKPSTEVLFKLSALPEIAEKELVSTCKDVSNPGILGTIGMLLETSKLGAEIDVEKIPDPVELSTFVKMYPGFGFVFTAPEENIQEIFTIFKHRDVWVDVIGEVIPRDWMVLLYQGEKEVLFDFEVESICGF
jgi:selenophosphate synthetase-related protein